MIYGGKGKPVSVRLRFFFWQLASTWGFITRLTRWLVCQVLHSLVFARSFRVCFLESYVPMQYGASGNEIGTSRNPFLGDNFCSNDKNFRSLLVSMTVAQKSEKLSQMPLNLELLKFLLCLEESLLPSLWVYWGKRMSLDSEKLPQRHSFCLGDWINWMFST